MKPQLIADGLFEEQAQEFERTTRPKEDASA